MFGKPLGHLRRRGWTAKGIYFMITELNFQSLSWRLSSTTSGRRFNQSSVCYAYVHVCACMCVCVCVCVCAQSCPTLCDSMNCSPLWWGLHKTPGGQGCECLQVGGERGCGSFCSPSPSFALCCSWVTSFHNKLVIYQGKCFSEFCKLLSWLSPTQGGVMGPSCL